MNMLHKVCGRSGVWVDSESDYYLIKLNRLQNLPIHPTKNQKADPTANSIRNHITELATAANKNIVLQDFD